MGSLMVPQRSILHLLPLQGLPNPVDAAGLPGVVVGQQLPVPAKTKRGRAAAVGCQHLSVTPSAAGMLQVRCVSVQQLLSQLLYCDAGNRVAAQDREWSGGLRLLAWVVVWEGGGSCH
jgi:hypothetical protein